MREKLKELSEILKQNTDIKERLEKKADIHGEKYNIDIFPQYSDILEYFGRGALFVECISLDMFRTVKLSPGPLSEQPDSTLDEIISLCKNVGQNK